LVGVGVCYESSFEAVEDWVERFSGASCCDQNGLVNEEKLFCLEHDMEMMELRYLNGRRSPVHEDNSLYAVDWW